MDETLDVVETLVAIVDVVRGEGFGGGRTEVVVAILGSRETLDVAGAEIWGVRDSTAAGLVDSSGAVVDKGDGAGSDTPVGDGVLIQ